MPRSTEGVMLKQPVHLILPLHANDWLASHSNHFIPGETTINKHWIMAYAETHKQFACGNKEHLMFLLETEPLVMQPTGSHITKYTVLIHHQYITENTVSVRYFFKNSLHCSLTHCEVTIKIRGSCCNDGNLHFIPLCSLCKPQLCWILVFTALSMKSTIFWDVMQHLVTKFTEKNSASSIRVEE
jgi:hypothetical protein